MEARTLRAAELYQRPDGPLVHSEWLQLAPIFWQAWTVEYLTEVRTCKYSTLPSFPRRFYIHGRRDEFLGAVSDSTSYSTGTPVRPSQIPCTPSSSYSC